MIIRHRLLGGVFAAACLDAHALDRGHAYGRKDALSGAGAEPDIKELAQKLGKAIEEVKGVAADATGKVKAGEELSTKAKEVADEALLGMNALKTQFDEAVQKLSRRGGGGDAAPRKSIGETFVGDEKVKGLKNGDRGRWGVSMSRKDVTSASSTVGTGASVSTSLVPADRQAGLINLPDRRLTIRDLITPGETTSSAIEYVVETGFTNAAAPVAETTRKPQSDIEFDLKNAPVRTLAHIFKASRQIMDDAPQLASYIDGRAEYGLRYVEEAQLLYGNGTGANLLGIMPQASTYAKPTGVAVAGETAIDRLRLAILQVILAEYPATGFVLNPIDWATIELTKDSQGRYLIAQPQGSAAPTIWGLPVVATQAMQQGHWLTGAFKLGAQIFDRMEIEVLLSTENEDDFVRNMVTIRAEERLALAVYRPAAFVTGTYPVAS